MDRQQLGGGDCCGRGAPEETEEVEERVFGVAAVSPTRLAWKVMQEGCPFASTTRLSTTPPMFQERILKSVIDGWLCLGRHGISTNLPFSIVNDSMQPLSRTIAVPFCVKSLTFWVSQSSRYCTVQPSLPAVFSPPVSSRQAGAIPSTLIIHNITLLPTRQNLAGLHCCPPAHLLMRGYINLRCLL